MRDINIPIKEEKEFADITEPFEYVYPDVQEIGGITYKHIYGGIYQPEKPVRLTREVFGKLVSTYCDLTFHVIKPEEYYDEAQQKYVPVDAEAAYTIYLVNSRQMALYDNCIANMLWRRTEFREVCEKVDVHNLDEVCWMDRYDGEVPAEAVTGMCRFRQVDINNRYQGYLRHIQFENKIGYLIEPGIYYFGIPAGEENLWSHGLFMNLNQSFEKEIAVIAYATDFHPSFEIAVEYMAIDKKNFARLEEIRTTRNNSFLHEFPVKKEQFGENVVEVPGALEAPVRAEVQPLPEMEADAVEIVEGIGFQKVRLGYQTVFSERVPVKEYEMAYFLRGNLVLYERLWKNAGWGVERKELDLHLMGELVVRKDICLKCGIEMERDIKVIDCKGERIRDILDAGNITFKTLRKYLSRIDRFSICMAETLEYKNYVWIKDIPDIYDDLYVYGIGVSESEFYKDGEYGYRASGDMENLTFVTCLEIVLSKEARCFPENRKENSV